MGGSVTKSTIPPKQQQQHVREEEMESFELNALPDDILQTVLTLIPGKQLLVYRRVCKRWRDMINSQSLWKDKCVRANLHYVNYLPEPRDFRVIYFKQPYNRNLITNPCAKEKLNHWKIESQGGDGFNCESDHPGSDPITSYAPVTEPVPCWATSYRLCEKSQQVDLLENGCSRELLDKHCPAIQISEWYSARFDCGGKYCLNVQLLSADGSEIDKFHFEQVVPVHTIWHQVSHTFEDYPAGVRFVRFTHSGVDTQFWAGYYGPKFTLSTVKVLFPSG